MADTDPDFSAGTGGDGLAKTGNVAHFEQIIDCSKNTLASGTSHALFSVPKNFMHLTTYVEPLTVEGGTGTVDIGVTGGDIDSLIDGANVNAATTHRSGDGATSEVLSMQGADAGDMLLADTTFSLFANNALDATVFRVVSKFLDCRAALDNPST